MCRDTEIISTEDDKMTTPDPDYPSTTSRRISQSHTYSSDTTMIHPQPPFSQALCFSEANITDLSFLSPSLFSCLLSADVSPPAALPTLFRGSILRAELPRSITPSVCSSLCVCVYVCRNVRLSASLCYVTI